MLKILRRSYPPALLNHLLERTKPREISSDQLGALARPDGNPVLIDHTCSQSSLFFAFDSTSSFSLCGYRVFDIVRIRIVERQFKLLFLARAHLFARILDLLLERHLAIEVHEQVLIIHDH